MRLGRTVKWTEDRQENFFATTQERGQIHDAELAVAKDGKILGVRDVFLHDTGAYDPYGLTVPINSQCTLLGPYEDRKSTRLNSSHSQISYAVFCLKKKKKYKPSPTHLEHHSLPITHTTSSCNHR